MRSSILALVALPLALAAPFRLPSDIFPREEASCNLSGLAQPASSLPAPTSGLKLVLVALGHGTQNYTCADSTAASTPVAMGALAQLFNSSCDVAAGKDVTFSSVGSAPTIGEHFFFDSTTPEFNVATLGNTLLKKTAADAAVAGATNVPWLKLDSQAQGTTSDVKEVYRLRTSGGVAPANCAGQKSLVTVEYSAQYWFYASS